jgi:translation initiation factor 1
VPEDRLVYSTDGGRRDARKPRAAKPSATANTTVIPDDGVVRIFRERGGRGGKTVTVVRGLPSRGVDLVALTGELKRLCGAGGTLREGAIEVQGDHRERIAERLRGLGYQVKLAGG